MSYCAQKSLARTWKFARFAWGQQSVSTELVLHEECALTAFFVFYQLPKFSLWNVCCKSLKSARALSVLPSLNSSSNQNVASQLLILLEMQVNDFLSMLKDNKLQASPNGAIFCDPSVRRGLFWLQSLAVLFEIFCHEWEKKRVRDNLAQFEINRLFVFSFFRSNAYNVGWVAKYEDYGQESYEKL